MQKLHKNLPKKQNPLIKNYLIHAMLPIVLFLGLVFSLISTGKAEENIISLSQNQNQNQEDLIPWVISKETSPNPYSKSELDLCTETLLDCDNAFNACNEVVDKQREHINMADEYIKIQKEEIAFQGEEIKKLASEANHSHIPIVAGTSSFWLLLLILL